MVIDLNIGDLILTGKWKNHVEIVEEFGINELGQPTVNGHAILNCRIKKLMPEKTDEQLAPIARIKLFEDFDQDYIDTDCRDDEGIAVGLIDGIIADLRTLRRNYAGTIDTDSMRGALADLSDDEDLAWLLNLAKKDKPINDAE